MNDVIHPAAVLMIGGLLLPLFRGQWKSTLLILLPVASFLNLISIPTDAVVTLSFLDFELTPVKVDRLSLVFGYIFHLIAFIGAIYIVNVGSNLEHGAGMVYAGSAIGTVFAGDFLTFFVFWELLTVCAVMLIWGRRTRASTAAGFRYLMVHVTGGLVLMGGIVMYIMEQQSVTFGYIGLNGLSTWLIFIGLGVNAAWPTLHAWLTDAYPESTVGGAVFLSAFTTKTAVYVLARTFPGTEALIWIGALMTAFPIFYAVIENDLRRVLSYILINQVGFMMVGIGIGTELSINGATAHAFAHILYESLLFMSMGAVMYRTGKINATDLGGLYKSMPLTALFCTVGAASISAFPLTGGFVTKSMVLDAAAHGHMAIIWLTLLFASAGVFHLAGIKIPFFAFFSHDAGHRVREAPTEMLIGMGMAAFLCIFIGVYPQGLYQILPYPVDFEPYTASHVLAQTQLLLFSALAFTLLLLSGIYPAEIRAINVDTDWLYRKGGRIFYSVMDKGLNGLNRAANGLFVDGLAGGFARFVRNGPAHLVYLALGPYWVLRGMGRGDRECEKERLYRRMKLGIIPVGLFALPLTVYLAILVFF